VFFELSYTAIERVINLPKLRVLSGSACCSWAS